MEGATATFAMFVPEPVAPADLGIAQAYYEVCAQRMMEGLPEEDKLEMYFIQDYFADFFFWKVTTKSAFLPVFSFKFVSNLPQIFLDEIWGKFESNLSQIWVKT